jgi:hypothetical protein
MLAHCAGTVNAPRQYFCPAPSQEVVSTGTRARTLPFAQVWAGWPHAAVSDCPSARDRGEQPWGPMAAAKRRAASGAWQGGRPKKSGCFGPSAEPFFDQHLRSTPAAPSGEYQHRRRSCLAALRDAAPSRTATARTLVRTTAVRARLSYKMDGS